VGRSDAPRPSLETANGNDLGELMMQAKAERSNPLWRSLAVLLTMALLLAVVTGSASAGSAGNGTGGDGTKGSATGGHKKCKKKPTKGDKAQANKKGKCKKRKPNPGKGAPQPTPPVTPPATPPAPPVTPPAPPVTPPETPPTTTTLAIDTASVDFGSAQHGSICGPEPDPDCPTHAFTITNVGAATSGVPTASITELHNPQIGGSAGFTIVANTCTAALAPGTSCSIKVRFAPSSNAGDEMYSSRLDVTASPGSTVSSALSGMAE
jgi:hypothetical protein